MCNLYSQTKGQEAIRSLARVLRDVTGNLPPMPGIFPDYPAPIVRTVVTPAPLMTATMRASRATPARALALLARANSHYSADQESPMGPSAIALSAVSCILSSISETSRAG